MKVRRARTSRTIAQTRHEPAKAMTISDVVSDFSAQVSFAAALPEPVCERRRELLPQMLHEWNRTDLRRYLPLEKRATRIERSKKIQKIRKRASELARALKALGQDDVNHIRAWRCRGQRLPPL